MVAEGTAIYVIVWGENCSSVESPPSFGGNEEELQACAERELGNMPPSVEASVDGQEVANLDDYEAASPMFTINATENGVYDFLPPGVALVVVKNVGFIVAPPAPGEYVIHLTDSSYGFDYTVNVTVEAPQIIEPTETTEAAQRPKLRLSASRHRPPE